MDNNLQKKYDILKTHLGYKIDSLLGEMNKYISDEKLDLNNIKQLMSQDENLSTLIRNKNVIEDDIESLNTIRTEEFMNHLIQKYNLSNVHGLNGGRRKSSRRGKSRRRKSRRRRNKTNRNK
jgi:hypothetical protein